MLLMHDYGILLQHERTLDRCQGITDLTAAGAYLVLWRVVVHEGCESSLCGKLNR